MNFLDNIEFEKDTIYIMDRGYLDFKRLMTINRCEAFFIVRSKKSLSCTRIYSNKVDKDTGLRCDQIIRLNHFYSHKHYPEKLRRIKYFDRETNKYYVYLTNNFHVPAQTIADLYKHRWQIELFFKWIKQHLKIQVFWGYSFNAVKTQICIAISTFLLVAIMKKKLNVKRNLYEILQVSQFEKIPLTTLIAQTELQTPENNRQKRLELGNV